MEISSRKGLKKKYLVSNVKNYLCNSYVNLLFQIIGSSSGNLIFGRDVIVAKTNLIIGFSQLNRRSKFLEYNTKRRLV